jgi:uncharacterized membrane protein YfcA
LILGGFISILSGFFGVGGGFILSPILLLIGFSPISAIVTSLMYTIGTSILGIFAHIRLKNIHWKEGAIVGVSGIVATQITQPFVLYIEEMGWDEFVIPLFYILLLSYFAITILRQDKKAAKRQRFSAKSSSISMVLIGLSGGMVSTALGVGGGFIIVPLLITVSHFTPKKAVGTSLFAVLMIVSVGFASYAVSVPVDYHTGGLLIVGALLGSQFGATLTSSFGNREINRWLGRLYIVTLSSVILKLFHLNLLGLMIIAIFVGIFLIQAILRMKDIKERNLEKWHKA